MRPGDVVEGKYRVERVLGEGGMGVVVAATHLHLDKRVAIKFLRPEIASRQDLVTRFVNEAKAASKIQSEHVVKVLDVGVLPTGAHFMVMELLEGADLAQLVKQRGPLPGQEAIDYVLQACEALAEAHLAGIVHRDLKPANLFLSRRADGSPCIKVLDFGISKIKFADGGTPSQGLTQTTAMLGSPNYMAPEQLRSARDVDVRADIWALGIILHELLTGEVAFKADTLAELHVAILQMPPTPLRARRPDAPAPMEAIVLRCLEKDPARRFASVGELAAALAELATAEGRQSAERITRILGGGTRSAALSPSVGASSGVPPTAAGTGYSTGPSGHAGYGSGAAYGTPQPAPQLGPGAYTPPGFAPHAAPPPKSGPSSASIALIILAVLIVLGMGGCAMCVCIGAAASGDQRSSAAQPASLPFTKAGRLDYGVGQ